MTFDENGGNYRQGLTMAAASVAISSDVAIKFGQSTHVATVQAFIMAT